MDDAVYTQYRRNVILHSEKRHIEPGHDSQADISFYGRSGYEYHKLPLV